MTREEAQKAPVQWAVRYRDRATAARLGNPLLGLVRARTQEEADYRAGQLEIDDMGAGLIAVPLERTK